MLRFLLLLPAIVLLALGLEGLYNAYRARDLETISCTQLRQHIPSSLRLHVTGCDIDYHGTAYREANGRLEELLMPARAAGAPSTQPAPLVIATNSAAALAAAEPVLTNRTQAATQAFEAIQRAAAAAGIPKEIRGVVRASVLERLTTRQVLSALSTPISENVLLLDLNGEPAYVMPAALLTGGLVLIGMLVRFAGRPKPTTEYVPDASDRAVVLERLAPYRQAPDIEASGTTAADLGDASKEIRLPAVMLLKLDSSAGPEAVETAPPLGTRDDVVHQLQEVLPDLAVNAEGHARHTGPNHEVDLDLGTGEMVHTAIVTARGTTGITAVRWVLETTGWRAFVPRMGCFADPETLEDLALRDSN